MVDPVNTTWQPIGRLWKKTSLVEYEVSKKKMVSSGVASAPAMQKGPSPAMQKGPSLAMQSGPSRAMQSGTSDAEEPPLKKSKQAGDVNVDQPMTTESEKPPSEKGIDDEAVSSSSDEENSDESSPTSPTTDPMVEGAAADDPADGQVFSITMDLNLKELLAFKREPTAFITRKMKGAEVSYGRLSPAERQAFDKAKDAEVNEFISTWAVRRCSQEERLEAKLSNRIIRARWVLTWKDIPEDEQQAALEKRQKEVQEGAASSITPDGRRKAKARIVLIGYQHPDATSEEYKVASPVVSHTGKLMFLQSCTMKGWKVGSLDAVTAFLQTAPVEESKRLWTTGVEELREKLKCEKDSNIPRILRSVYGLTTSPRAFYEDVAKTMKTLGGRSLL
jgi:hypothetical protein